MELPTKLNSNDSINFWIKSYSSIMLLNLQKIKHYERENKIIAKRISQLKKMNKK